MSAGRLADRATGSHRAFRTILFLTLAVGLAATVYGGLRVWQMGRPDRAARESLADDGTDLTPGRPVAAPPALAEREWPSAGLDRAAEPAPAAPPPAGAVPEQAIAPAPTEPPPAPKRSDVSPAALAAERSRIALAELGARQDRLAQSGPPPAGAPPAWSSSADALRNELGRSLITNTGLRVSGSTTCFRAGCLFSVDAANEAADVEARGRLKMLLRGEMPNPFPGRSFVSGLVTRPDGYLRTTVILYGPEGGEEAK